MIAEHRIWIGLVKVRSLPESKILEDVSGSFVNVLTWASHASEFRDKAKELMNSLVENPEPLEEREKKGELEVEIAQVALEVKDNPHAIRYMTFHTWKEENA